MFTRISNVSPGKYDPIVRQHHRGRRAEQDAAGEGEPVELAGALIGTPGAGAGVAHAPDFGNVLAGGDHEVIREGDIGDEGGPVRAGTRIDHRGWGGADNDLRGHRVGAVAANSHQSTAVRLQHPLAHIRAGFGRRHQRDGNIDHAARLDDLRDGNRGRAAHGITAGEGQAVQFLAGTPGARTIVADAPGFDKTRAGLQHGVVWDGDIPDKSSQITAPAGRRAGRRGRNGCRRGRFRRGGDHHRNRANGGGQNLAGCGGGEGR